MVGKDLAIKNRRVDMFSFERPKKREQPFERGLEETITIV